MLSKEKIEKAKLEIYMVYSTSCDLLHSHILTVPEINDLKILLQYIQELEISNAELDKENNRLEKIEFERDMLKKGQNSLMSSRKKWKDRYYKLKAKNKKDIESWENVLDCAKYEINKREQENKDIYWKGYIQKQKEAVEICKICKYRKQYLERNAKKHG